jgi:hypothetical protein
MKFSLTSVLAFASVATSAFTYERLDKSKAVSH